MLVVHECVCVCVCVCVCGQWESVLLLDGCVLYVWIKPHNDVPGKPKKKCESLHACVGTHVYIYICTCWFSKDCCQFSKCLTLWLHVSECMYRFVCVDAALNFQCLTLWLYVWVSACIGLCVWLWLQAATTANSAMTTANFSSDNCQFTANFNSDHWQFSVCCSGYVGVSEWNRKDSHCQVSEHLFVWITCKSACVFCDCLSLCALDRRKSTRCERVSL